MTERLTEKITNRETGEVLLYRLKGQWGEVGDNRMRATKKLGELEDAEEDGRLVALPCKVGDTVYVIEDSHIEVFEVNKIELKHKVFGNATYYLEKPSRRGCLYKYYDSEFGVKWFVDREEAEKALKEMEGKQGE